MLTFAHGAGGADHLGSFLGEKERRGFADAAARPRDYGYFTI
jgi:hypothetical protein